MTLIAFEADEEIVRVENVGVALVWMFWGSDSVTPPVDPLTETWLVVPVKLVTPEFVTVTEPVEPLIEIPVPAANDVTPVAERRST